MMDMLATLDVSILIGEEEGGIIALTGATENANFQNKVSGHLATLDVSILSGEEEGGIKALTCATANALFQYSTMLSRGSDFLTL
jgi:hypothetical protein